MRTTLEMKDEHRARLLELAARRGEKGFSRLVAEAIEAYLEQEARNRERRKAALLLRGALTTKEADRLLTEANLLRESWR